MCRIMTFFILQLRSQHPYAETFVGHPLVYTINIWNKTEVTKTIKTILGKQVRGLSAKYWISILFNTRLLDTFFFYSSGETICSFRIFLRRNAGKIKCLYRKSGKKNSIYNLTRICLSVIIWIHWKNFHRHHQPLSSKSKQTAESMSR